MIDEPLVVGYMDPGGIEFCQGRTHTVQLGDWVAVGPCHAYPPG
jgi:hypothetical protein